MLPLGNGVRSPLVPGPIDGAGEGFGEEKAVAYGVPETGAECGTVTLL